MDPNANLIEQLTIARTIVDAEAYGLQSVERLAELVLELDSWLRRGGFMPAGWMPEPFSSTELDRRRQTGEDGSHIGPVTGHDEGERA